MHLHLVNMLSRFLQCFSSMLVRLKLKPAVHLFILAKIVHLIAKTLEFCTSSGYLLSRYQHYLTNFQPFLKFTAL